MTMSRRSLMGGLGAASAAWLARPRLSWAATPADRRLVLVQLRGGLDGLAAVVPWGDPDYRRARGARARPRPGAGADAVVDLDGGFGLNPALGGLKPLWDAGELAVVHAVALPGGQRSHFDAQDLLESGAERPGAVRDGWLNRAQAALPGAPEAAAIGGAVPLVLRGEQAVTSLDPARDPAADADFVARMAGLYAADPVLGPALGEALATRDALADGTPEGVEERDPKAKKAKSLPAGTVAATGRLLAAAEGPRVAVLDVGGWDTHARQEAVLQRNLTGLARGLLGLRAAMGDAWSQTVVVVVSEFGRTVAANGTGGSDHGTAGVVLLAGGGVGAAKVHGEWPGLAERHQHEGRDLKGTTDMRAVFAAVARDWLGVDERALAQVVLPGVRPVGGLFS